MSLIKQKEKYKISEGSSLFTKSILFFVILNLAVIFYQAVSTPIQGWDALAVWCNKANVLMKTKSFFSLAKSCYPAYPPHLAFQIFLLKPFGDQIVKMLPPIYLMCIVIIFYGQLKIYVPSRISAIFAWLVTTIPRFRGSCGAIDLYSAVPLTAYLVPSTIYLYGYLKKGSIGYFWLWFLLGTIGIWTRPDGFISAFINLFILTIFITKREMRLIAIPIFFWTGLLFLWRYIYISFFYYVPYFYNSEIQFDFERLRKIIQYCLGSLSNVDYWGPLFWFTVIMALFYQHVRRHIVVVGIFILNLIVLIITYHVVSTSNEMNIDWWLETGFNRGILHFIVILYFFIGLICGEGLHPIVVFMEKVYFNSDRYIFRKREL